MDSKACVWILCILTCFIVCSCHNFNQTVELLQKVLQNYDRRVRPSLNQSQPIVINVSFGPLNIEDLDEVNSKISVTGYLYLSWIDEMIKWNASYNHGISRLLIPVKNVWYPELVVGYFHGNPDKPVDDWLKVYISHTGLASLSIRDVYKSTCKADVTYYPFDSQTCSLTFVTRGYDQYDIHLRSPERYVVSKFYIGHGEWEIVQNSSTAGYPTDNVVTCTFKLQRKPLYYVVNIILPIVIMSLLNVLVFALPSQSGEKVSYSITVLLAIAVFMTMVSDSLPRTSRPMSLMSYFLMVNLMNSALICVMTIFNMCVFFKDNTEPFPAWVSFLTKITYSRHRRYFMQAQETKDKPEIHGNGIKMDNGAVTEVSKDDIAHMLTWKDISELIDRLCIVGFLFVTVVNSGTYIFLVTRQYESIH